MLSWAGQRAPIYPLHKMRRSLGPNVVPTLAASLIASFGLWENRKVLLMRGGAVQKTRRLQKAHACCAGRYGRQRGFPIF